ncbi:MAG: xanthine dehydrogenase family protein molybdopterin-binding subunit, partial [Blastomonas fulva]
MRLFKTDMYNTPDTRNLLDHTRQGVIGKPLDRPEGPLKVSGSATYSAEWKFDNCAEGVLVLSTIAQGTVETIHKQPVLDMPGVLAVLADEAMTRRSTQGTAGEAPVQDVHTVEYFAQPIALVVAENFEQARDAALALKVDYAISDEPIALDPESPDAEVEDPANSEPVKGGDLDQAMRDA